MGSSKKQTIGYRYSLGEHIALVHGPVDKCTRLRWDERVAWEGSSTGGRINVDAANLFGGDKREGGVSGAIDFETGAPAQGRNSYLQARLGTEIPAFRGVASLVFRQLYLGNNPYLKPMDVRLQRIHVRQDGVEQWYDEKSGIPSPCSAMETIYTTEVLTLTDLEQTWTPPAGVESVDVLLVGEGGYGTPFCGVGLRSAGGGGGGGQVLLVKNHAVSGPVPYQKLSANFSENRSKNTKFGSLVALGGGIGIDCVTSSNPANGWAGGGGGAGDRQSLGLQARNGQTGAGGRKGGNGFVRSGRSDGGGGAGAGTDGTNAADGIPGVGGVGVFVEEFSQYGDDGWFGGGGGGAGRTWGEADNTGTFAQGGKGGGGTNGPGVNGTGGGGSGRTVTANAMAGTHAGGDGFLAVRYVSATVAQGSDMNPAHIIRECLTDPDWGMGYPEDAIDDTSFTAAADQLFSEQMGISILWDRQSTILDFVDEIVRHIDAALFVSRTTGKFVLKLIRGGYNEGTLLVLDESNVERVESFSRPTFGELINTVTINYEPCS